MSDPIFPLVPALPLPEPVRVERVVRRDPLVAIQELLSVSIHEIVNEASCKRLVGELYRISRWIENEEWLRRQLAPQD